MYKINSMEDLNELPIIGEGVKLKRYLKLKQDVTYKLHRFEDSQWVKVTKDKVMIGLCFDLTAAYQVVFTHIVDNGGQCEKLDRNDFKY